MLHIPKIDNYLEILTDEEVKDFAAINFRKSIRGEQNLRKGDKSRYIFVTSLDELEKHVQLNSSDNCVHHHNVQFFCFFRSRITTD